MSGRGVEYSRDYRFDPRMEWDKAAAKEDTHLWKLILTIAHEHCRRTCYTLWFFRESGARLMIRQGRLKMIPTFGNEFNSSWDDIGQYKKNLGAWLMPHVEIVKTIFAEAEKSLGIGPADVVD